MSTEWLDIPWFLRREHDVPLADCERCEHNWLGPGHCYMFEQKPGDRCGQFSPLRHPGAEEGR